MRIGRRPSVIEKSSTRLVTLVLSALVAGGCGNTASQEEAEAAPGQVFETQTSADCAAGNSAALQDLGDDLPSGTGTAV